MMVPDEKAQLFNKYEPVDFLFKLTSQIQMP